MIGPHIFFPPDKNSFTSPAEKNFPEQLLLQFNGTSTSAAMERRFDFYGSPMMPRDAIGMADLMISAGYCGKMDVREESASYPMIRVRPGVWKYTGAAPGGCRNAGARTACATVGRPSRQ